MTVANVQQLGICAPLRRAPRPDGEPAARRARGAHGDRPPAPAPGSRVPLPGRLARRSSRRSRPPRRPTRRRASSTALIELGVPGGRTGVRTHDAALALARAVGGEPQRRALGPRVLRRAADQRRRGAGRAARSAALMQRVKELAIACDREGLFAGPRVILTAGGSAAFDIVARELPMRLSAPGPDHPAQRLLRHPRFRQLRAPARRRQGAQRRRLADAPGPAAGARGLVAGAVVPRAGAGDPDDGQARRLVRHRDADRRSSAFARRRTRRRDRCRQAGRSPRMNDQHAYLRWRRRRGRPAAGRRPDRLRHLASVHDLRQVARAVHGRRRLSRHRRDPHLLLIAFEPAPCAPPRSACAPAGERPAGRDARRARRRCRRRSGRSPRRCSTIRNSRCTPTSMRWRGAPR